MKYRFADLVLESSEALPELDETTAPAEVQVHWPSTPCADVSEWFYVWFDPQGAVWLRFGRGAGEFHLEFPDLARFVVSTDASWVAARGLDGTPLETVRHMLLNQILPLVLSRRGRLVLHGSAVAVDGTVTAILGATGVGKSTLAAACCARGGRLVTDDALIVRSEGAALPWSVIPSYRAIRLWPESMPVLNWTIAGATVPRYSRKLRFGPEHQCVEFESGSRPLSRIVVLADALLGVTRADVVRGHRALILVAPHLFRLDIDDASETVRLFKALSSVVANVTVICLETRRAAEQVADLWSELFGHSPTGASVCVHRR